MFFCEKTDGERSLYFQEKVRKFKKNLSEVTVSRNEDDR
jgi:hypothetical protein